MQDVRRLQPRQQLALSALGDGMVYAVNSAYVEIGRGGVSAMRGWGALAWLALLGLGPMLAAGLWLSTQDWLAGELGLPMYLAIALFSLFAIAGSAFVSLSFLVPAFFSVTDSLVRLDSRRQKVWMWTRRGPIEMSWARLVPHVSSGAATVYSTVKVYTGQYAELGADGKPLKTHGIEHVFQVGSPAAVDAAVLSSMEYLRRYMEIGPHAVEPPSKLLSHRPKWYVMVNFFFGLADDWVAWHEGRGKPGGRSMPLAQTFFGALLFPILFPLQFTNWLALRVAPIPKWPKELVRMHEQDLVALRQQPIGRKL